MRSIRDTTRRWIWMTLFAAAGCAGALGGSPAGSTPISGVPHPVVAELVSEVASIRAGEPFWVAVRLRMREDWHVNWINPGDAGLAPSIDWKLPAGFRAGGIVWPYPERFESSSLCIFGYGDEVLIPVQIIPSTAIRPGETVALAADATWLACRDVCLPGEARLGLELPVRDADPPTDPRWSDAFRLTRGRIPIDRSGWSFTATLDERAIVLEATPPPGFTSSPGQVLFFPVEAGFIENASRQRLERTASGRFRLEIERARIGGEAPERIRGVLVAERGWSGPASKKALSIDIPVE